MRFANNTMCFKKIKNKFKKNPGDWEGNIRLGTDKYSTDFQKRERLTSKL